MESQDNTPPRVKVIDSSATLSEVITLCNSNNQSTKAIYKFNTQTIVDKVNDVRAFAVASDTKLLNITAKHQDEIVALKTEVNTLTTTLDHLLTITTDVIDKIAYMTDDGHQVDNPTTSLHQSTRLTMRDLVGVQPKLSSPSIIANDLTTAEYPSIGCISYNPAEPAHQPPQLQFINTPSSHLPKQPTLLPNFLTMLFIPAVTMIYLAWKEKIQYNKRMFSVKHAPLSMYALLDPVLQQVLDTVLDDLSSDAASFLALLGRNTARPSISHDGLLDIIQLLQSHRMPDTGTYLNQDDLKIYMNFILFLEKCIGIWRYHYPSTSALPDQRLFMKTIIEGLSTGLRLKVSQAFASGTNDRGIKFIPTSYSSSHMTDLYASVASYGVDKAILFDVIAQEASKLIQLQNDNSTPHVANAATPIAGCPSIYSGILTSTTISLTDDSQLPHPSFYAGGQ